MKGAQVATVAYLGAALLALLSIAGFAHALRTSKDQTFAGPDHAPGTSADKHVAGV